MRYNIFLAGIVAAIIIFFVTGCAQDKTGMALSRHTHSSGIAQYPAFASNEKSAMSTRSMATAADVNIPENATVEDYVQLALARNPGLIAARQKVSASKERIKQEGSLQDPMLKVAPIGEMAETAAGQVDTMMGVSQTLPFPGKLSTKAKIASKETDVASQELIQTQLSLVADVRRAYWGYYFTSRAIEVTQQNHDLLEQFHQVAQSMYSVGTGGQQDVLRASVELSNLTNELLTWKQRRQTAAAMLNSLIDRPVEAALPQPPQTQPEQLKLELNGLLAQAERFNPELGALRERTEADRQRLNLANLNRWPDLTLGYDYGFVSDHGLAPSANGKDQWWITFSINLPIWFEKLDAAEREARYRVSQRNAELKNTANRVSFRVQDAFIKVDTQQRLVTLFHDVIIPQAQQTVDVSSSAYQAGRLDFLTLIDNWRKLLNYKLMYHQSVAQLEQDFADLQQVVGKDVGKVWLPEQPK
jgi:cobalt-zinc-cadmium efflux system outer membrane protein